MPAVRRQLNSARLHSLLPATAKTLLANPLSHVYQAADRKVWDGLASGGGSARNPEPGARAVL